MITSQQGIDLIKSFEGLRLQAYPDGNSYSVGYGHHANVSAGTVVTQEEAEELLRADLANSEAVVNRLANATPDGFTQNQFDALVSLAYNIGSGNFQGSTVARLIRQGGPDPRAELRNAWMLWVKSKGKTLTALVRRRNLEYDHYSANDTLKKKL